MREITEKIRAAYDAVAYESMAYPQTHPHRMAAAAILRGMVPEKISGARILELGCALGGNLIPMAEQLPDCRFLGIDLSPRQIEAGSAVIRELKLGNIELRSQDISDFAPAEGQFDYIIAHGFYSWIPAAVRKRVLEICQAHLSPGGLAYISYNALPGWHQKGIVRDLAFFRARRTADPTQRATDSREIVQFVAENAPFDEHYQQMMRFLSHKVKDRSDSHLLHEYLDEINQPFYFWQFVEEIAAHGLAQICEHFAVPNGWLLVSDSLRRKILQLSNDPIDQEQYLDFVINRAFRGELICRKTALQTPVSVASRMGALFIAQQSPGILEGSDTGGRQVVRFGAGPQSATISDPRGIRLLGHLGQIWPAAIPLQDAASIFFGKSIRDGELDSIVGEIMPRVEALSALGVVELWPTAMKFIANHPSSRPKMAGYARWQAINDPAGIVSLRHRPANVAKEVRQLMSLLDGTRDRQTLVSELNSRFTATKLQGSAWDLDERWVGNQLDVLAKASFLLESP
jgi:SAM-dependent methyltransferase